MNEKPLERLNYYNGQRLEASDLKLEQEYQVRVRRWLNKTLYPAGIARGLEVRVDPASAQRVLISPGLALDAEGREIILLEGVSFPVVGKAGLQAGNYLTIQYREETLSEESENCAPGSNGQGQLVWGGPARIRATPLLGWSDIFPHESSGKVVLAQVELDGSCNVLHVHANPRRYIGQAAAAMVRQYALEGERHIDKGNSGRIYFHIRGRQPNAVTLYLRAELFSTLYYTELGQHTHDLKAASMGMATPPLNEVHAHALTNAVTKDGDGEHKDHKLIVHFSGAHSNDFDQRLVVTDERGLARFEPPVALPLPLGIGAPVYNDILPVLGTQDDTSKAMITQGSHIHGFLETTETEHNSLSYDHTHSLKADGKIGDAGVSDAKARSDETTKPEKAFTYVDDLQVYIYRVNPDVVGPAAGPLNNYTPAILTQLKNAQPGIYKNVQKLGDHTAGDPLAKNGSGPIRLDFLSSNLSFTDGEYCIDLQVKSGGGRILYNLYVE